MKNIEFANHMDRLLDESHQLHKKLIDALLQKDFRLWANCVMGTGENFLKILADSFEEPYEKQELDNTVKKILWKDILELCLPFAKTTPFSCSSIYTLSNITPKQIKMFIAISDKEKDEKLLRVEQIILNNEKQRIRLQAIFEKIGLYYENLSPENIEKIIDLLGTLNLKNEVALKYIREILNEEYAKQQERISKSVLNKKQEIDYSGLNLQPVVPKLGYRKEEIKSLQQEIDELCNKPDSELINVHEYLQFAKNLFIVEENRTMVWEHLHDVYLRLTYDDETRRFLYQKGWSMIAQVPDLIPILQNIDSANELWEESESFEDREYCEELLKEFYRTLKEASQNSFLYEQSLLKRSLS